MKPRYGIVTHDGQLVWQKTFDSLAAAKQSVRHNYFNEKNVGVMLLQEGNRLIYVCNPDGWSVLPQVKADPFRNRSVVYDALRHYYKQGLHESDEYDDLVRAMEAVYQDD